MAAAQFKHIRINDANGIAVVQFVNSQLMFATNVVDEIGVELESLISDHAYPKIVLDFRDVQYVSSMMLAKLANLQKHADVAKRQLKLCGLGPVLKDTFRIGHFDRVFSVYDDAESAMKSF
jgi:anti-sigma B factor antagonist